MKTDDQLDLQALHRVRSRLVGQRTAVINQIRAFCWSMACGTSGASLPPPTASDILAKRTDVFSPRMIRIIEDLLGDWRRLDERIDHVTEEIEALAPSSEGCRQLMTAPGIGPIIASAMVAAIGDGTLCRGPGLCRLAWLGPEADVDRRRTILGRISKRGNRYLRSLLMQGGASFCSGRALDKPHFDPWLMAAAQRLHHNVLATAFANKLARIAWTVLAQGRSYEARVEPKVA